MQTGICVLEKIWPGRSRRMVVFSSITSGV